MKLFNLGKFPAGKPKKISEIRNLQSDVSKSAAKMCTLSVLTKCNSYILRFKFEARAERYVFFVVFY